MTTSPLPTDGTAQTVDDILKVVLTDVVAGVVENSISSAVPVLNLPVIKQVLNLIVSEISKMFYEELRKIAEITIIGWQTADEEAAYNSALAALQSALAQGNPAMVSIQTKAIEDAFTKLIHFDGVTH